MTLYLFFLGTILHLLNKLTDPFPLLLFTYNSNCTMYTFEIRSNCLNLLSKRFMKGILPPFENKYFDDGKLEKYKRLEKPIIMRRPSKCTGFMNHFIQDVLQNKMRSFKTILIENLPAILLPNEWFFLEIWGVEGVEEGTKENFRMNFGVLSDMIKSCHVSPKSPSKLKL